MFGRRHGNFCDGWSQHKPVNSFWKRLNTVKFVRDASSSGSVPLETAVSIQHGMYRQYAIHGAKKSSAFGVHMIMSATDLLVCTE